MTDLHDLLPEVRALAREAGRKILQHYQPDVAVERKDDGTPVTIADRAAEALILEGLARLTPEIPVIAEEAFSVDGPPPVPAGRFWLVDPLDGTKEFLRRNGEFTVNIALVRDGQPVLGVVHAPVQDATYWAAEGRAFLQDRDADPVPLSARRPPECGLVVVASRSHGKGAAFDGYIANLNVAGRITAGSSIKFCLIARGEADIYPRFGTTMEWDTAAGHAILTAAGGRVETIDGAPLRYGKPGYRNPHFVAFGRS